MPSFRIQGRHVSRVISAVLTVGVVAACAVDPGPSDPVRPTPTPGPPSIRPAAGTSWIFDGRVWTLYVTVEPKGVPTDVTIEWGTGTETGPFDHVIPMAEAVIDVGRVSTQTSDLPVEGGYCLRFTATNTFGSASTPAACSPRVRPSS